MPSNTRGVRAASRYAYGTHLWVPETQQDFSLGMFRDTSRVAIPPGGVYDAQDLLLHKPGVAFKRGGTSYSGPVATSSSNMLGVVYCQFPTGNTDVATVSGLSSNALFQSQLIGLGFDGAHAMRLYQITAGTTNVFGSSWSNELLIDKPKLLVAGKSNLLFILDGDGVSTPVVYGGTKASPFALWDAQSANQVLTITGAPAGGTFTIQIGDTGLTGTVTTGAINWNASAANVTTALNAVSSGYSSSGGALPGAAVTITRPQVDLSTIGYPFGTGYANLYVTNVALTGGASPAATLPLATTTSTAPTARHGEVHLSRMVLANSKANPNRAWFGPLTAQFGLNTAAVWDTANAWLDFPDAVTGLASLGSTLLAFSQGRFWRVDGDTPPPGTNMSVRPVAGVGCTDARSITVSEGTCYFANPTGVYATPGTGAVSLMEGRIASYWQGLLASYDPNTWSIATGIYGRRFLFVTVVNNSGTLIVTLVGDLRGRGGVSWSRHSNINVRMYASPDGAQEELYGASRVTNRVLSMSGMFSPTASNKNDADGTAVTPLLETRPYGGSPQVFAFGHGEIAYDMQDAASDNPTLAIQYAKGVEATTYATVPDGSPLAETTDEARARISVNQDSQAVSLKLQQSNASSKTEIYSASVEQRPYTSSADGQ